MDELQVDVQACILDFVIWEYADDFKACRLTCKLWESITHRNWILGHQADGIVSQPILKQRKMFLMIELSEGLRQHFNWGVRFDYIFWIKNLRHGFSSNVIMSYKNNRVVCPAANFFIDLEQLKEFIQCITTESPL